MPFKVVDAKGRAFGGTGKHPCKLRKTADAYVRVLQEMYGKKSKFTVVESG